MILTSNNNSNLMVDTDQYHYWFQTHSDLQCFINHIRTSMHQKLSRSECSVMHFKWFINFVFGIQICTNFLKLTTCTFCCANISERVIKWSVYSTKYDKHISFCVMSLYNLITVFSNNASVTWKYDHFMIRAHFQPLCY